MPKIRNLAELESIRCQAQHSLSMQQKKVLVCCGTGCIAGGSLLIYDRIKETCRARGIDVCVELKHEPHGENIGLKASGCHGFCEMGPLLKIEPLGVLYIKVKLSDCDEIIERSIIGDEVIERLLYTQNGKAYQHQEEIPFYHKQTRIVLSNCGQTNAEDVLEYIAKGGYSALSNRTCADAAAAASRQEENGTRCAASPSRSTTLSATVTREIPAPLWTAASWREIPTRCWRE